MKLILIVIVLSFSYDGGAHSTVYEQVFRNQDRCEAAASAVRSPFTNYPGVMSSGYEIKATCVAP